MGWQAFSARFLRAVKPRTVAEARAAMRAASQRWRRRPNPPRSWMARLDLVERQLERAIAEARGLEDPKARQRARRRAERLLRERLELRERNPAARKRRRRPTGGDWQPDLFGGRGIARAEGLTKAEQLELARQEMRDTGSRDLFDWQAEPPARRNAAETPRTRFLRAASHGERITTATRAAINPGHATGRTAPSCPVCGARVRLSNPPPPTAACGDCGTVSRVRMP